MGAPALERAAPLVQVNRFVVSAGDPTLVTTDVTEDHFDHVRRDAEAFVQRRRTIWPG